MYQLVCNGTQKPGSSCFIFLGFSETFAAFTQMVQKKVKQHPLSPVGQLLVSQRIRNPTGTKVLVCLQTHLCDRVLTRLPGQGFHILSTHFF